VNCLCCPKNGPAGSAPRGTRCSAGQCHPGRRRADTWRNLECIPDRATIIEILIAGVARGICPAGAAHPPLPSPAGPPASGGAPWQPSGHRRPQDGRRAEALLSGKDPSDICGAAATTSLRCGCRGTGHPVQALMPAPKRTVIRDGSCRDPAGLLTAGRAAPDGGPVRIMDPKEAPAAPSGPPCLAMAYPPSSADRSPPAPRHPARDAPPVMPGDADPPDRASGRIAHSCVTCPGPGQKKIPRGTLCAGSGQFMGSLPSCRMLVWLLSKEAGLRDRYAIVEILIAREGPRRFRGGQSFGEREC